MSFRYIPIVVLALLQVAQSAFVTSSCTAANWIVPFPGNDTVGPVIAVGPKLVTNALVINSTDDTVSIRMLNPLVTDYARTQFKRSLKFMLIPDNVVVPTNATTFAAMWTANAARTSCRKEVLINTTIASFATDNTVFGSSTCQPTFELKSTWEALRNPTTGCNLVQSTSGTGDAATVSYKGKIVAMWQDTFPPGGRKGIVEPPRPASVMYYPWSVSFKQSVRQNTSQIVNGTDPYSADSFAITDVLYTKSAGELKLKFSYKLTAFYPYVPLPCESASTLAGNFGVTKNPLLAGTVKGFSGATVTLGAFTSSCVRNNLDGTPATVDLSKQIGLNPGDLNVPANRECQYSQTVEYTWAYSDTNAADASQCDVAGDYTFNWATCTYATTDQATNGGCIAPTLSSTIGGTVGAVKLPGSIDLCKAPNTDYSLAPTSALAPGAAVYELGTRITLGTTISSVSGASDGKKFVSGIIQDFTIEDVRAGSAFYTWTLYQNGAVTGASATLRTNTAFSQSITLDAANLVATVAIGYTPNVGGATKSADYLVALSDRTVSAISLRNTLRVRFYFDTQDTTTVTRRLLYRDSTTVTSVQGAADLAQSATARIKVPANMQAADTATVASTSSAGLSTAAVAGIAAVGTAIVVAGAGIGALIYRRRRSTLQIASVMEDDWVSKSDAKVYKV